LRLSVFVNNVDRVTKINEFELPKHNGSREGVVYPGDKIDCSANGRPQPTYTWYRMLFQNIFVTIGLYIRWR